MGSGAGWTSRRAHERDFLVIWEAAEPKFKPLHDNPRFQRILRSIGL